MSLGQFEQVVLTAILSLDENAYGVTIHARVEEFSHPKSVSRGAVYATLDRMTDKGLVRSWMSDPIPERGGRSRRYYRLEPVGERALREAAQAARRLFDAVEQNWGSGIWQPEKS